MLEAAIRTPTGTLVWDSTRVLSEYEPVTFSIECRTRGREPFAPGMYFFIINYGKKRYIKKFLIVG